jgi:patatin-like phospholipase/acyl hydrolase
MYLIYMLKNKSVNLLSIDGGGIRGVMAAKILYLIEKEFNVNIYDYFDIFTGTSVGSMIIS